MHGTKKALIVMTWPFLLVGCARFRADPFPSASAVDRRPEPASVFQQAEREDTIISYENFIRRFPCDPRARKARERILKKASLRLSLSTMTLPHEVARLVLAEQLYRAGSILRNEPYHKGP